MAGMPAALNNAKLINPFRLGPDMSATFDSYAKILKHTYSAIEAVTGCDVLVDASKYPLYLECLMRLEEWPVYMLHVVRDPRAVEYSKRRRRDFGHPYYKSHHSTMRAALAWTMINQRLAKMGGRHSDKYLRIHYEDFVRFPEKVLDEVGNMMGTGTKPFHFVDGKSVRLDPIHAFAGSPHRASHKGVIELREDRAWVDKLGWWSQYTVLLLTRRSVKALKQD